VGSGSARRSGPRTSSRPRHSIRFLRAALVDPDALAAEFASRNVEFSEPLKDDDDGLRGFELKDIDGYVLFFGRPRS
jgi:hypothetical protein